MTVSELAAVLTSKAARFPDAQVVSEEGFVVTGAATFIERNGELKVSIKTKQRTWEQQD